MKCAPWSRLGERGDSACSFVVHVRAYCSLLRSLLSAQGRLQQTSLSRLGALGGLACKSRPGALSGLVDEEAMHASRLK